MDHLYRPYYDLKVKEIATSLGKAVPDRSAHVLGRNNRGLSAAEKQELLMRKAIEKQQKLRSLRPPPPDEFITSHCPQMTIMEM